MLFDYHTVLSLPIAASGLKGYLAVPASSFGIVLFSFGSGVHDLTEQQHEQTKLLHRKGIGTLLFDPLTEKEKKNYANRFNIELLADRLLAATKWLRDHKAAKGQRIGYYGAGAGAAAALAAAAQTSMVSAVVCRDGKLKPPADEISSLKTPTLLVAAEMDETSVEIQRYIFDTISCKKELLVITGTGRNYEKADKADALRTAVAKWFACHLAHIRKKKV